MTFCVPQSKGGRLLTLDEARALMGGSPLYPGEDQWCAVQGRDWVQVGSKHHQPGKSHVRDCGSYPPWGDDAANKTYGKPTWNLVALYKQPPSGGGGKDQSQMHSGGGGGAAKAVSGGAGGGGSAAGVDAVLGAAPRFCSQCGALLAGPFCSSCGAAAAAVSGEMTSSYPSAPPVSGGLGGAPVAVVLAEVVQAEEASKLPLDL